MGVVETADSVTPKSRAGLSLATLDSLVKK